MFAKRMELLESSGIRAIFDLAGKMKNPINLSLGQPHFDVPDNIKEAAIEAIRKGKNSYTPTTGIPPLKDAIKASLIAEGVPCEDILATSGGSAGLLLALLALADDRMDVLVCEPAFLSYRHLINLAGATPVFIDTYPDFRLTPEKLEAAVTPRSRILLINSPANPTGTAYSKEEITLLAKTARRLGLQVISDEVYDQFCYDFPHESWLKHDPTAIMVRGFSKTYAMPGWRAGYVAGPKALIEQLTMLQQFTFVCIHQPTQWAGVEALKTDVSHFTAEYRRKRDFAFNSLKDHYHLHKPNGAFYLFPEAPRGDTPTFIKRCLENELLVVPGGAFSKRNTHFRISYATDDRNLERGIELLIKLAR